MTLEYILSSLYRKLNYASSPSSEVKDRLTGFLNEIQHRVMGLPGMGHLRQGQITFATVASTAQYSLPQDVSRVIGIRNATDDAVLRGVSWEWYQANEPDPTSNVGDAECWAPAGFSAVASQPSDASKVYVDSTSASDTCTCYVEGIRTGGYPFASSVTMTGATAVQIGSWTDIIAITKFYLSANAVGTVTLVEDAEGGTELSRIPIGKASAKYLRIALWPCPSDAVTLTLDYMRQVPDMSAPHDSPWLPDDFHWVLEAGAKMLEYEKQDDRRYPAARAEYEKGIRDLKWFVTQQADGGSEGSARSSLGPWYPAGS